MCCPVTNTPGKVEVLLLPIFVFAFAIASVFVKLKNKKRGGQWRKMRGVFVCLGA